MEANCILVIEDDPAIGQSLLDGFSQHGFKAELCKTGSSGIEFAQKHSPHLILLDIRLPDGSGFDFCRKLRSLGLHQPIIMLTAQRDELDKVLGLEMGADDYVTKPFSLRELVSRVRAQLRRAYGDYSSAESTVIVINKEIPYSGPAPKEDIILSVSASPYGYGFVAQSDFDPSRRSSQVASAELIAPDGRKLGDLEFSNGPSYGADVIDSVTGVWLVASVFAIAIAALAGWFMSKTVTWPVIALENATREMEQGNLSVRVNLQKERQLEFLSLANSFNGMAEQVEKTVSTLREFVADAAHELHTPLTALQANLELAREEKTDSERTRYLSRAQEQGRRLESLVQSLLDLSRIEAVESKTTFASVDLTQLVRELGEQFASRAEQAERSFSMSLPEAPVYMQGNDPQLRQVFINLLENALKFTPRNGSITLEFEHSGNVCQLLVRDDGIGIPIEDQPYLFERFHRGRNASEYAGNGLGLAIVKAIVTRHGGSVTIQSQPGQGTQVQVSLPT